MPGSLNSAQTQDRYVDALTVVGPMAGATVLVYNAPIMCQLGTGGPPGTPSFTRAEFELPNGASVTIRESIEGLRVRSSKAGVPATVTVIPSYA